MARNITHWRVADVDGNVIKDIEEKIVSKCTAISNKYKSSRMTTEKYREKILKEFYKYEIFNKPEEDEEDGE